MYELILKIQMFNAISMPAHQRAMSPIISIIGGGAKDMEILQTRALV
jgi:hypothetical protein